MNIIQTSPTQPVTIILGNKEELNIFHHIVNFNPSREIFYNMVDYEVTYEQIQGLRLKIWLKIEKLNKLR